LSTLREIPVSMVMLVFLVKMEPPAAQESPDQRVL